MERRSLHSPPPKGFADRGQRSGLSEFTVRLTDGRLSVFPVGPAPSHGSSCLHRRGTITDTHPLKVPCLASDHAGPLAWESLILGASRGGSGLHARFLRGVQASWHVCATLQGELGHTLNALQHIVTKKSQNVLSKFSFMLGCIHSHPTWHVAHGPQAGCPGETKRLSQTQPRTSP